MIHTKMSNEATRQKEVRRKILTIRNLTVLFKSQQTEVLAVDSLNLDIHEGEVVGLVGESGSGKSVTGLSIMGLLSPKNTIIKSGSITFDGVDLLGLKQKQRRSICGGAISMIFQEPMTALNPTTTIGEQITEVLFAHKVVQKGKLATLRAQQLLREVELIDVARIMRQYPHQLSGGMRQRAMIAMALACSPRILIADEPTTALDVTVQKQILALFKKIQRRTGVAILFISHNLPVVESISDEVAVLYAGRIMESGPAKRVLQAPKNPYTKGLLAASPKLLFGEATKALRESIREIPGSIPVISVPPPQGCHFASRCAFATDICRSIQPTHREFENNRVVYCHHPL